MGTDREILGQAGLLWHQRGGRELTEDGNKEIGPNQVESLDLSVTDKTFEEEEKNILEHFKTPPE